MQKIKKQHHYVWQAYLRSWIEKDNLIFAYLKKENKVAKPNLKNVTQERFFYLSEEFTIEEQKELLKITHQLSNKHILQANLGIFSAHTAYSRIIRKLKENNTDLNENDIKFIKTNFIEDIHSDFEAYGNKLIKVKRLEDLAFLKDKKELLHTLIYLCIQYTRTRNMKNNFSKSSFSDKFSNPISMIMAIKMADALTYENNLRFNLLINKSSINFITSDQPAINLSDKNKEGSANDFVLYYPINPKTSIVIELKNGETVLTSKHIEESEVKELNLKIYQNANNFIFSDSEQQVSYYKTQKIE